MIANQIPHRLYRLARSADWQAASAEGFYRGVEHDHADGFIHLSTAVQVPGTAARYYKGLPDVILLTLDSTRLQGELKMEPSTGGDLFPHLYGAIPVEAVMEAGVLAVLPDGSLEIPSLRGDI